MFEDNDNSNLNFSRFFLLEVFFRDTTSRDASSVSLNTSIGNQYTVFSRMIWRSLISWRSALLAVSLEISPMMARDNVPVVQLRAPKSLAVPVIVRRR